MPSKRKFYRTVVQVEVLSEEPLQDVTDIDQIVHEITYGDCSGRVMELLTNHEIDGPTAARLLMNQESDPSFFNLTEDGEDTEEHDGP